MTLSTEEDAGRSAGKSSSQSLRDHATLLTVADRFALERFLGFAEASGILYPDTLLQILRAKLATAGVARHPAPLNLATLGRQVSYRLGRTEPVTGVLSAALVQHTGELPIHSMIGATLVGMTAGQQVAFDIEGDRNRMLILIDVVGAPARWKGRA